MVADRHQQGVKIGRRFPALGGQNCTPKHIDLFGAIDRVPALGARIRERSTSNTDWLLCGKGSALPAICCVAGHNRLQIGLTPINDNRFGLP